MTKIKSVKDAQAFVKKAKPVKSAEFFVVEDGNIFTSSDNAYAHAKGKLKVYHLGKKEDK